jgi:hypothetical protein
MLGSALPLTYILSPATYFIWFVGCRPEEEKAPGQKGYSRKQNCVSMQGGPSLLTVVGMRREVKKV